MLKGNDLILTLVGTRLAAAKGCSVDRNVDTIEVCSPTDGAARNFVPTTTSWAISANGLYANASGAERLRQIWRQYQAGVHTPMSVQYRTSEGIVEQGLAIMTSLQEQGNVNEMVKFSIQLQGSGPLLKVGSPLTMTKALDDAHIRIYDDGYVAIEHDSDDQIDYVDIQSEEPFQLNFETMVPGHPSWELVPGNHQQWVQDLEHFDEYENIDSAHIAQGMSGVSKIIPAGNYVLYACNLQYTTKVELIK